MIFVRWISWARWFCSRVNAWAHSCFPIWDYDELNYDGLKNVYGIPFSMVLTLFLFLWHYHCHSICLIQFLCVFNIYLTHHSRFMLRRYLAFIFIGFGIFFTTNMKPINICLVYRRRTNIKGIIFTFQSFTVVNLDVIFHFFFSSSYSCCFTFASQHFVNS